MTFMNDMFNSFLLPFHRDRKLTKRLMEKLCFYKGPCNNTQESPYFPALCIYLIKESVEEKWCLGNLSNLEMQTEEVGTTLDKMTFVKEYENLIWILYKRIKMEVTDFSLAELRDVW